MNKRLMFLVLAVCTLFSAQLLFSAGGQEAASAEEKVVNRPLIAKIRTFDPATIQDRYTNEVSGEIMEPLFQYSYLKDTYELEPLVAESMPQVSADGLTYTFKIRKDAYYYDPLKEVFPEGKGRNVMAKDFILSIQRLADPFTEANGWWLFEGRIVGLDEWRAAAEAAGTADYNAKIEGVKLVDDYTFQIKLKAPFPQILYNFAMSYTFPTVKEVMEYYGEEWVNYPIGSGAFYYDHENSVHGSQHVLLKNPTWHGEKFPSMDQIGELARKKLPNVAEYAGKDLPFVDKVVFQVIEEDNPRWLKFQNGEIDFIAPPKDFFTQAVVNNELTDDMEARGVRLDINPALDVTYYFFNMEDPVVGQVADPVQNEKNRKLRLAMSMAWDTAKYIEIFDNGRAVPAQTVIPPGFGGWDPDYVNPYRQYNVQKAKQLLAEAGYPNGQGLPVLRYDLSGTSALSRETAEFFANYMAQIGIKMEIVPNDWPTFITKIDNKEVQFGGIAWGADYPDAQNFLQLLYGPNASPGPNSANYRNPEFDKLYEQGSTMQQSPERDAIYTKAARIAVEDAPWIVERHRLSYALENPWLENRYFRDIGAGYSKYYDIDLAAKNK